MRKFYNSDFTVGGKVTLDYSEGSKTLKQLKSDIKDAEGTLISMSEKFGETSIQAQTAAKRVAELKDQLGDAKNLVDAFNPDKKFAALAQSLNGVLGGFTALTGAMGLLGVESEDVQKQLLKVQSALALSQGINQIGESINSFKNLGQTIVQTLGKSGMIGIAIAGVAALGASLLGLFDGVSKSQKALTESLKEYEKAATDARKAVVEVQSAFKAAESGVISKEAALKKYNETLGDTFGKTNDLSVAEERVTRNAENYIKITGLKAQANALFAKSAEASNAALVAQQRLDKTSGGFVGRTLQKGLNEANQTVTDIDALIQKVYADINDLQSQGGNLFGGLQGAAGSAKTPGGKLKQTEVQEVYDAGERLKALNKNEQLERTEIHKARLQQFTELGEANVNLTQLEKLQADQRVKNTQEEEEAKARFKIAAAKAVGDAFGALSELIGKQTAAGKALAIAQATINMWLGVTEVLRAKNPYPEPFGTIVKVSSIATVIASGINAIKNIVKTPVPGASGGSAGATANVSSPVTPRLNNTTTTLDQNSLNAIGNATNRAFVLEHDVSTNQERIRRLNRMARIG